MRIKRGNFARGSKQNLILWNCWLGEAAYSSIEGKGEQFVEKIEGSQNPSCMQIRIN